jgi:hypothetical protein
VTLVASTVSNAPRAGGHRERDHHACPFWVRTVVPFFLPYFLLGNEREGDEWRRPVRRRLVWDRVRRVCG